MYTEFWLSYHLTSRAHLAPTTQLIELEHQEHKLSDLEDLLEHVFRQGFIEARHRPAAWWEKKDGFKVKAISSLEDLLNEGVGKCPETALKLVVEDMPAAFWFTYVYLHQPHSRVVTQRIKFAGSEKRFEKLAHVTNHVFAQGFLPCKYRPTVHWQTPCGRRINEYTLVNEILINGGGACEEKALRLVIDDKPAHYEHCLEHHIERHIDHHHHHHEHISYPCTPTTPKASPIHLR
ncbi:hypothetical protein AX17_006730 [Amanita inopinata Kibby_2008]|nr:hypothetical protein AX17_006730 [Amanita inopinata Kibby_2008]